MLNFQSAAARKNPQWLRLAHTLIVQGKRENPLFARN